MEETGKKSSKKMIIIVSALVLAAVVLASLTYWYVNSNQEKTNTNKDTASEESTKGYDYKDIGSADAYKLMQENPDLVIVDVSPRFDKGHIPGAVNYYIGDGTLDKAVATMDRQKTYLVYCHVDSASIPGAQKLVDAGIEKVYRLEGNYGPWLNAGYPIEISLKAEKGYAGTASATRSFLDGKFLHTVTMKTLDPAAGKFFEGWLVKGTAFFSTGKMIKDYDSYVLKYESGKDSRDYKKVVITEETTSQGLDNKPETHVFEGDFE